MSYGFCPWSFLWILASCSWSQLARGRGWACESGSLLCSLSATLAGCLLMGKFIREVCEIGISLPPPPLTIGVWWASCWVQYVKECRKKIKRATQIPRLLLYLSLMKLIGATDLNHIRCCYQRPGCDFKQLGSDSWIVLVLGLGQSVAHEGNLWQGNTVITEAATARRPAGFKRLSAQHPRFMMMVFSR